MRRSRIEAELAASRIATEAALRRSRIAAEVEAERIAAEDYARRARVNAELAASRMANEINLRDSLRRIRVQEAVDSILRRY